MDQKRCSRRRSGYPGMNSRAEARMSLRDYGAFRCKLAMTTRRHGCWEFGSHCCATLQVAGGGFGTANPTLVFAPPRPTARLLEAGVGAVLPDGHDGHGAFADGGGDALAGAVAD